MSIHTWSDYNLALYDRDRALVAVLDEVAELRWEKRLYGGGAFSFRLPMAASGADAIARDALHFVRLWRGGQALLDGYFERPAWELDADGGQWLVVEGLTLGHLAHWRSAVPLAGGVPLTVTAPIDDALKWVVRRTLGSLAPTVSGGGSRVLPGLVVDADTSSCATSDTITYQARPGYTLHDFLCKWGGRHGVDWELAFNGDDEIAFSTYCPRRGADRTVGNAAGNPPVIVNDAVDSVATWRLYWSAREHHNAWIGRTLAAEARDAAAVTRWLRRETISPSSDPDANAAALSESGVIEGVAQAFVESAQCQFMGPAGASFAVGDAVTVGHLGQGYGPTDLTVAAVQGHVTGDGREALTVVFGDPEPSAADRARRGPGAEDDPFALPYAVPAVTFGVAAGEGSAAGVMRADAVLPLSLAADSGAATPDPDDDNLLTLSGGRGCTTSVAAAPGDHAVIIDTDWQRDTVGGQMALFPYVAGDDLRVRASGGSTVVQLSAAGASLLNAGATLGDDLTLAAGIGIVHGDGVSAGLVLRANGARFVPAALAAGDLPDLSGTYAVIGHGHDHGALTGLGDDDHPQYLLASGARGLSADWNAGAHTITCAQISIPSAGYLNETSNDLQLVADTDDLRLISTVDDVLVQAADRVIIKSEGTAIDFYAGNALTAYLTSAALYPASTNGAALGLTSRRWSWLRVSHIDAAGNVTVAGTLGVTGAATLGNTLAVTGAATLSSTLGVTGAATLASTLAVSGAATLGSTLAVTGAVTLSSTLNVSSTITGGGLNIGGEARCDTLRIDTLPGTYGDQTLTHCFPISLNGTTYRVPVYVP